MVDLVYRYDKKLSVSVFEKVSRLLKYDSKEFLYTYKYIYRHQHDYFTLTRRSVEHGTHALTALG